MSYSRTWDETTPLGTSFAADLDTDIQQFKTDIRERLAGILGLNLAQFTADPIAPISLVLSSNLTLSSSAAVAGLIRTPNNQTLIAARNAAGTGDLVVAKANASDVIEFAAGKLTINPSTGAAVFAATLLVGGQISSGSTPLVVADANGYPQLGSATFSFPGKLSRDIAANLAAGSVNIDGVICIDTTNSRIVYYVGGLRYWLPIGTAF